MLESYASLQNTVLRLGESVCGSSLGLVIDRINLTDAIDSDDTLCAVLRSFRRVQTSSGVFDLCDNA